MKKFLFLLSALWVALHLAAFITRSPTVKGPPKIPNPIGRWERTLANGGVWIWTIRPNGTFSVSSKGKDFASGQYRIKNGIYDVNDANCNVAYHGRYRFTLYANDSIRFSAVEDTCLRRRGGMEGAGWKRLNGIENNP